MLREEVSRNSSYHTSLQTKRLWYSWKFDIRIPEPIISKKGLANLTPEKFVHQISVTRFIDWMKYLKLEKALCLCHHKDLNIRAVTEQKEDNDVIEKIKGSIPKIFWQKTNKGKGRPKWFNWGKEGHIKRNCKMMTGPRTQTPAAFGKLIAASVWMECAGW